MISYKGREIHLATMHQKEKYLNPPCEKILGAKLIVSNNLNTDSLGTFTGEIERKGTQKEVALKKCYMGLENSDCVLGLASEGSFGMHPMIPLAPVAFETLVFVDTNNKLEIFESKMFTQTNFSHKIVDSLLELTDFLKKIEFPSHGVIVRPHLSEEGSVLFKGIQTISELEKAIKRAGANSSDGKAFVQTDMRCHMNPTRGLTLRKLGILLFRKLTRCCPKCKAVGWGKTGYKTGRPCLVCNSPTHFFLSAIWSCNQCFYEEEKSIYQSSEKVNPMYCDCCNP